MYDLDSLIPQKPPMRFIDKLIGFENETVHCQSIITPKHLLFNTDRNSIPHWTAVEIMAQTAAVYGKLQEILTGNSLDNEPKIAFLMSVRQYKTEITEYKNSSLLDVYAECSMMENGIGVFNCRIEINNKIMASVVISAYQPQNNDDAKKVLNRNT
jgi:predicted hotdog family 3-hydroxylacyl-ACP dehydratase